MDSVIAGMNLTVLFMGASFSGKEKLFDGDKYELPLACHFIDRLFATMRQKFRKFEVRMRSGLITKEKVYDCNSENKYNTLRLRENDWEGAELVNINTIAIENAEDFKKEAQRAIKQKNRLVLEFKDLYSSYLDLTIIRDGEEQSGKVISNITFLEIPGLELLAQSHNNLKNKEATLSTKSLLNFASILNDLSKNPETIP